MLTRRIAFGCFAVSSTIFSGLIWVLLTMPLNADTMLMEIKPGTAIRSLAYQMYTRQYIPSAWLLEGTLRLLGSRMQAGEYPIAGETTLSFARNIAIGKRYQHSFTIVEGWDIPQVLDAIAATEDLVLSDTDLLKAIPFFSGSFLAETYFYEKGYRDRDLLLRAHKDLQEAVQKTWSRGCHKAIKDPASLIILASLIEKEASVSKEHHSIANVLLNRLEANMRLQVDPTVYFALEKPYTETLTREDLRTQSPYNTYQVTGLPPGPIATVSESAIEAACQGNSDNYFYYVAKGDGTHHFSQTHEEHVRAVKQYIRG